MKHFSIAVIPGDGVGQEVVPAAIKVLDAVAGIHGAAFDYEHFDWGAEYYFRNGRMTPVNAIDLLRPFHAIFLGAVGDPKIPDHITLNGLLLPIRRAFDQFANVRPAILYAGVKSPLAQPGDIDMLVVRENTEANTPRWAASFIISIPTKSQFRRLSSRAAGSMVTCRRIAPSGLARNAIIRAVLEVPVDVAKSEVAFHNSAHLRVGLCAAGSQ